MSKDFFDGRFNIKKIKFLDFLNVLLKNLKYQKIIF